MWWYIPLRRSGRAALKDTLGRVLAMAKGEETSKRAASAAAKTLRDPKASPAAKSAAGSALTQRPNEKK